MGFLFPHFNDIIDICLIAFLIYQTILILKKSDKLFVLFGIVTVFLFYLLGLFLKLRMVIGILTLIKDTWILILVILFQQEIRNLLKKINVSNITPGYLKNSHINDFNSSLIDAVSAMSFRKIGAIIVLEKKRKLDDFIAVGEIIDAYLSLRLIMTIFNTKSLLHDGAIIIRDGRIIAAKVVLPLSQNHEFLQKHGTRHLAAIGITEISDAMAIVVSEQTGRVSLAMKGNLRIDVPFEELMQIISDATK